MRIAAIIGVAVLAGCSATPEPPVTPSSSPSATPLALAPGVEKLGELSELGSTLKVPEVRAGTLVIIAECLGKSASMGGVKLSLKVELGVPCSRSGRVTRNLFVTKLDLKKVSVELRPRKNVTAMRAVVGWKPGELTKSDRDGAAAVYWLN